MYACRFLSVTSIDPPLGLAGVGRLCADVTSPRGCERVAGDLGDGGQVGEGDAGGQKLAPGVSLLDVLEGQTGCTAAAVLLEEVLLPEMEEKNTDLLSIHDFYVHLRKCRYVGVNTESSAVAEFPVMIYTDLCSCWFYSTFIISSVRD